MVACLDKLTIFFDNNTFPLENSQVWNITHIIDIPDDTQVLRTICQVNNTRKYKYMSGYGARFRANIINGTSTHQMKCYWEISADWGKPNYDDSSWADILQKSDINDKIYANHTLLQFDKEWGFYPGYNDVIYCRKVLHRNSSCYPNHINNHTCYCDCTTTHGVQIYTHKCYNPCLEYDASQCSGYKIATFSPNSQSTISIERVCDLPIFIIAVSASSALVLIILINAIVCVQCQNTSNKSPRQPANKGGNNFQMKNTRPVAQNDNEIYEGANTDEEIYETV
jgi:hypothetical protein